MPKNTAPPEPTYVEIDGQKLETTTVMDRGQEFVIRELTVEENDLNEDASVEKDPKTDKETFNARLHLRLSLATAIVSPKVDVDDIAKWPGRRYVIISRAYNRLNLVGSETDPNAPRQSGSNDSTSPTSGEDSQTTSTD